MQFTSIFFLILSISPISEIGFATNPRVEFVLHDKETKANTIICEGTAIWPQLIATSASCASMVQFILKKSTENQTVTAHPLSMPTKLFPIFEATPISHMGIGWVTLRSGLVYSCVEFDFPHFGFPDTIYLDYKNPASAIKIYNNEKLLVLSNEIQRTNGAGVFSPINQRLVGVFSGLHDTQHNTIIAPLSGLPPCYFKTIAAQIEKRMKHSISSVNLGAPKLKIGRSPSDRNLSEH